MKKLQAKYEEAAKQGKVPFQGTRPFSRPFWVNGLFQGRFVHEKVTRELFLVCLTSLHGHALGEALWNERETHSSVFKTHFSLLKVV